MAINYVENRTLKNADLEHLALGEYDQCIFQGIDFSGRDLSSYQFIDCQFQACNLSLVSLKNTIIRDTHFNECKLLGLEFFHCNQFAISFGFDSCLLDHASFFKMKISKSRFVACQMHECDFTASDLRSSIFDNCDLMGARFEESNLEKVDFRTALHYSIDPEMNKLKGAKFSLLGIPGLLYKYGIIIE